MTLLLNKAFLQFLQKVVKKNILQMKFKKKN